MHRQTGLRLALFFSRILRHSPPLAIPTVLEPGLYRAARRDKVDRPDRTGLCGERRGKEREREEPCLSPVGTGSSRQAERDFGVPLDLRRHSGCLERRGEALCVLTCTWIWVHSCLSTGEPLGEFSGLL